MSSSGSPTWESLKEKGNSFFKSGNYASAIEYYGKAIQQNSNEAALYSNRAAAHLHSREYESAIQDALRAIEVDPLYTKAFSHLHQARVFLGRFREAAEGDEKYIAALQEAIARGTTSASDDTPMSPTVKSSYAEAITKLQLNAREARQSLHTMTKAQSLLKEGGYAPAESLLRSLFIQHPSAVEVVSLYAQAKAPSDPEAANGVLTPFLTAFQDDPNFLYTRAFVTYQRGPDGFKNAQLLLRSALTLDPDHSDSKQLRKKIQTIEQSKEQGNTFFKSRSYDAAVRSYTEALEADPHNKRVAAVLRGNRSAALVEMKQWEKAVLDCDFAIDNGNAVAKMFSRRSKIYEELEKWDMAQRDITKAAEMDQQYQGAARALQMRAKKAKRKDYYKILGVSKDASEADVKRAYKRAALQWHPDKWAHGTEEEKTHAEQKFKDIGEALAVLGDARKRSMYDNGQLDSDVEGASAGGGGFSAGNVDITQMFNMMFASSMMGGSQGRGGRRGAPAGFQFQFK